MKGSLFFIFFIALLFTTVKMGTVRIANNVDDVLLKRPDNAACNSACDTLGYGGGQYQCCYETVGQGGTITYQPKCVCSG